VNARNLVLSSAMLFPLLFVSPVEAQRVNADIIIGGGPVSGRITIGDRRYDRRPRMIRRVEWVRRHDNRRADWYRKFRRDHHVVVVYYDRRDDRYFLDRFQSGLVEIRVYERDGRYYRLDDDRDFDRYDERYDGRYGDRRGDRRDDRRDDRRGDGWDDRRGDRWNYDDK
jgi:hypothetical protein